MHILITGAAGMIGRKLTARLVKDGGLGGKPIDRLTLIDVVAPEKPVGYAGAVDVSTSDLSAPGAAAKAIGGRPEVIFHLAGVVSGEAEIDFEKGYRVNLDGTRALLEAIHTAVYKPKVVFTSSIAAMARRFPLPFPMTSTSRRSRPTGRRKPFANCCLPITRGEAYSTASEFACQPSACGRASQTKPRPAFFQVSFESRSPGRKRFCRSPKTYGTPMRAPELQSAFLFTPRV